MLEQGKAMVQRIGPAAQPFRNPLHPVRDREAERVAHADGEAVDARLQRAAERVGGPAELEVTAFTTDGEVMGLRHREWPVHGVQFHPEVTHTKQGRAIYSRFVHEICGCDRHWNMPEFAPHAIARIREQIGRAARNFEFFAEVASTLSGEAYSQSKGYLTYVTREPKGVAALIYDPGERTRAGFYAARRMRYAHTVWHLFVLGGAAAHFLSVWLYVG